MNEIIRAVIWGSVLLVFALLNVLFLIYMERKVSAFMQRRLGPMRHGPWGLLQTLFDVLKMIQKEDIKPRGIDRWLFWLAPAVGFTPALMVWLVIPFGPGAIVKDLNIGIIFIAAITSYSVIAIFMSGWGSNNKYSLLGAMRGAAQMISYEVTLVMSIIGVVMMTGSLSLVDIVNKQIENGWFLWPQLIGFVVYVIASLAELNRAPFDLTEAESELVAGYVTEFSSMRWGVMALGEYTNLLAWSSIAATLFLGGWTGPTPGSLLNLIGVSGLLDFEMTYVPWLWPFFWLMFKTYLFVFLAMWIRWTLPRVRIDQLMDLGWKFLLPVSLFNILLTGVLRYFQVWPFWR